MNQELYGIYMGQIKTNLKYENKLHFFSVANFQSLNEKNKPSLRIYLLPSLVDMTRLIYNKKVLQINPDGLLKIRKYEIFSEFFKLLAKTSREYNKISKKQLNS